MSLIRIIILSIGLLFFLVGIWAYPKIDHFFKVDECLDKGGRWNYETQLCEFSDNNIEEEQMDTQTDYLVQIHCDCAGEPFVENDNLPITYVQIDGRQFAICGYQDTLHSGRTRGCLNSDSCFIGKGYSVKDCAEQTRIFMNGEYYVDSVCIAQNSIVIYRMIHLPVPDRLVYNRHPFLQIEIRKRDNDYVLDSTFVLPDKFLSPSYLEELNAAVELAVSDTAQPTKYPDLKMHYLFLRAMRDTSNVSEFINSGPYDGYLGPIFRDLKTYVGLKSRLPNKPVNE